MSRCAAALLALMLAGAARAGAADAPTSAGGPGTFDVFCSLERPVVEPGGSVKAGVVTDLAGGAIEYRWTTADGAFVVSGGALSQQASSSEVEWTAQGISPGVHVLSLTARAAGGSAATCSLSVVVAAPERGGEQPSIADLRRAFLASSEVENPGFGLYSYLILPSDCASSKAGEARDRCALFVQTALGGIIAEKDLKQGSDLAASRLNLTYLLVTHAVPADLTADLDQSIDAQVRWILDNYDYPRAHQLLLLLGRSPLEDGPIVVSLKDPVFLRARGSSDASAAARQPYLYQNYADVPLKIVPLWLTRFQKQSLQASFSQPNALDAFSWDLRKYIAIAGLGLPAAESAVKIVGVTHQP